MPKVTGQRQAVAGILAVGTNGTRNVGKALFRAAEYLAVEAQISLTTGAQSGKGHVPSLPGQPPNEDTGTLGDNIEATRVSDDKSIVTSNAEYALALEFGTSKMAARPYMKPALQRTKPILKAYVDEALGRAKRGQDGTR